MVMAGAYAALTGIVGVDIRGKTGYDLTVAAEQEFLEIPQHVGRILRIDAVSLEAFTERTVADRPRLRGRQ